MTTTWKWKNKDGAVGGLLYEPGNWGDMLKMLWLLRVIAWKRDTCGKVHYFDPFAGDVHYPLNRKTHFRLERPELSPLQPLRETFFAHGLWPSAASAVRTAADGSIAVWDADAERRNHWRDASGVTVMNGGDGWRILRDAQPDVNAVWLIDPYDFLAEWREQLPLLAELSRSTCILLYLYNRSAKSDAAFREYRAFANALEDVRGPLQTRRGRIAADVFLPRAHHEVLFLPGGADAARPELGSLLGDLAADALALDSVFRQAAVCDA